MNQKSQIFPFGDVKIQDLISSFVTLTMTLLTNERPVNRSYATRPLTKLFATQLLEGSLFLANCDVDLVESHVNLNQLIVLVGCFLASSFLVREIQK